MQISVFKMQISALTGYKPKGLPLSTCHFSQVYQAVTMKSLKKKVSLLLTHLSQRLIDELIV